MYEIVKCKECGEKVEFIKAVEDCWKLPESDDTYLCPKCLKQSLMRRRL